MENKQYVKMATNIIDDEDNRFADDTENRFATDDRENRFADDTDFI